MFDLSWNNIGNGSSASLKEILDFFKTNESMVHLDLSNCSFNYDESLKISEIL